MKSVEDGILGGSIPRFEWSEEKDCAAGNTNIQST